MYTSRCLKTTTQLRVTIPRLVRDALGLDRGTTIAFEVLSPTECKLVNIERKLAAANAAAPQQ
jgi:bifunctional DNA-binding transcriptional regulator/antitoxin component of YhaV-PrlF toxin-antitoxin module